MIQLFKGQLLIPKGDNEVLREPHLIVDIDAAANRTALLPLERNKLTSVYPLDAIREAISRGVLVIGEQRLPHHVLAEKDNDSDSRQKLWEKRISRLEGLVAEGEWKKLLYGNDRGMLIRRHVTFPRK